MADGTHFSEDAPPTYLDEDLELDKDIDAWFAREGEPLEETRARLGAPIEEGSDPYADIKYKAKKTRGQIKKTLGTQFPKVIQGGKSEKAEPTPSFSRPEEDWFQKPGESTEEARARFEKKHGYKVDVPPDIDEDFDARMSA